MTLLGLMSAKGAPGVTATAIALAHTRERATLVVEADPAGGALAARLGLRLDPGLSGLSAAGRHELSTAQLLEHRQPVSATVSVLVGPSEPRQMVGALGILGGRLVDAVRPLDVDVIFDLGRMDASSPALALARHLDLLAWLAAPSLEGIDAVLVRRGGLEDLQSRSVLVTTGDGPYDPRECATVLGLPLAGHLPHDEPGIRAAIDGQDTKRLARRPLARALAQLSVALLDLGDEIDREPLAEVPPDIQGGPLARTARLSTNGTGGSR